MTDINQKKTNRLTNLVGLSNSLQNEVKRVDDQAWIDVIHQMDNIYADLVHYQVELEEKNSELEDAQSFIQSVISSMSEILIVCDTRGLIQQVNEALSISLDISQEKIIGKPFFELFSDEYLPQVMEFQNDIRSGTSIECEIDLINARKQPVPMAVNCNARFDHDDRLSGLVITGRPLGELKKAYAALQKAHTDLKKTQLQLVQSEKMASLGRLVAGVAHELNNPISFLFANMHALKNYQQKIKCYINSIHQNINIEEREKLRADLNIDHTIDDINPLIEGSLEGAERVTEIVQNLQKFSTPQQTSLKEFDLVKVVKRATSWVLQSSALNPQITEQHPKSITVINNQGYVHQIIINLVQNAIDAMRDQSNPLLFIQIKQVKQRVKISIKDNGYGIQKDNLIKIFDPFFTTKTVGQGMGLGLYISYGLATEQCHGDLAAFNLKEGGAKFVLTLPLKVKE